MSERHWVRLTDQAGHRGAWLNMQAVAAVREDERGDLHVQVAGEATLDPAARPVLTGAASAAVRAYLEAHTFAAPGPADERQRRQAGRDRAEDEARAIARRRARPA